MDSPRDQHYYFSHAFLKEFYFNFYDKLNSESVLQHGIDLNSFIKYLWDDFNKLTKFAVSNSIKVDDISIDLMHFENDKELWLITMPKPEIKTEAYYVGFYFNRDLSENNLIPLFFTLEYSDNNNSFFCYWDQQEAHHNLGLVEPTKEAFKQNIRNFYQKVGTKF